MHRYERIVQQLRRGGGIGALLLSLAACTGYQVIPSHLEQEVTIDLTYDQVDQNPEAHVGHTIIWAGKVLGLTQDKGRTSIEVLHLPLDGVYRPMDVPTASQGRFMAYDPGHAITVIHSLQKDTLVTVIGEVRGRTRSTLDQGHFDYLSIAIKDMTAWKTEPGIQHTPPGSQSIGFRPFVFWESRRVVGHE